MSYEAKQSTLSIPGTELQGLPVQIFPGATARSLLDELHKNPALSAQIKPSHLQVVMIENGMAMVFDPDEDIYPTLNPGSILELWSNAAPHLG